MKTQFTFRPSSMRRTAMFVALFTLSAIAFIACDKQNAMVEPQTENAEAYKFSYQGKIYEAEEFERLFRDKKFPLMVTGTDMPEKNTIYVFDSKADYQGWTQTTPFAGKLAQVDEAVAKARNNPDPNPTALSKSSGFGGWAQLHDDKNYLGEVFYAFATGIVSSLGPFDEKTSAVLVRNPSGSYATICSIYEFSNFQGMQFIIINLSSAYTLSFQLPKNWDNITSSFIVL